MRVFGTVKNPDFGEVEETGILITISDIYPVKSERHFKSNGLNTRGERKINWPQKTG